MEKAISIQNHLINFRFGDALDLFGDNPQETQTEYIAIGGTTIPKFINEFWTSKQRQTNSIHEISYRACFKPQLPRFFIQLLTKAGDTIYDPFSGRGTTVIEAALLYRNIIANDINPLSEILSKPRLCIPDIKEVKERLYSIPLKTGVASDIDLSMFYHPDTEAEVLSLRDYLKKRNQNGLEDYIDRWIRMVATNRLTGHSSGFFSVYTLPPNQAVSPDSQKKINEKRKQTPSYRDTNQLILKKTISLIRDVPPQKTIQLRWIGENALFLIGDARFTPEIKSNSIHLTVTSPPFLDIVQYDQDNWLRCWFNSIDAKDVARSLIITKRLEDWCKIMGEVFEELFRITAIGGHVAFEVGELRGGDIRLEEYVVPLGLNAGFKCEGVMINQQKFTKTANIWGVSNNEKGTNTNRIVIFKKD